MFNYFDFYRFYSSPLMVGLRFLVAIFLTFILVLNYYEFILFRLILLLYVWYIINEIFIHFKLNRSFPRYILTHKNANFENSTLFKTRKILSRRDTVSALKNLSKTQDADFVFSRIGGYVEKFEPLDPKTLFEKSQEIATSVNGRYITSADVIVSYLLLTEEKTNFLFKYELTQKDIIEILIWAREKYSMDVPKDNKLHFTGYGVFDFFIYGWDTMVREYSYDISFNVINQHETPIVGREHEFSQMVTMLSKSSSNNVLLIGESGVGKSSLVKKLALESYKDPRFVISHVKVYELLADRLLAGVESSGDLEMRLTLLLAELEHAGNIILFIQNIENIFGGGGFNFDMSGVLFGYLKSGRVQIIGTTTPSMYKTIIEKKTSIANLFESIRLEEPSRDNVFRMIASHVDILEKEYKVTVSYKAIHESVELSSTYMPDLFLPGKAINLLSDAAAQVRINGKSIVSKEDVIAIIQEKTNIILEKPTEDEKKTLLSLEDELHKRVIGQNEAVDAVAKSIRRLRSGFSQHDRPISVFLFLGPTGVGKTETAKALAQVYFGDENAMIRLDMSEYQSQGQIDRLLGGVTGGQELSNSLPEAVHLHPFSLLLLDEFEKAHPQILDIFLQIFEDGRLTDNQGRTVSFKNTIIIATSNAGSEAIRQMVKSGVATDVVKNDLVESLLSSGIFKPELLNRFDDVVVFKPLTLNEAGMIAKLLLTHSLKTLEDDQIYVSFDESVVSKIVRESYDEEAGARNMRRYIGSNIEDFISRLILEDKLERGAHVTISTDTESNFVLQ